jgi:hypothetical protein
VDVVIPETRADPAAIEIDHLLVLPVVLPVGRADFHQHSALDAQIHEALPDARVTEDHY